MQVNFKNISRWLVGLLPLAFLLVFYFFPLGKLGFQALEQWTRFGLRGWNWEIVASAVGFTFFQASLSTLLTLLVGIPAAYLFSHFRFWGREFLRVAATLPFILPTVVVAAAFNALLGPRGWMNLLLMRAFDLARAPISLQNTLAAILLAHVFYNLSIVIRVVSGAWEQVDSRMGEAARVLGASPWRVLAEITLPLLLPSIFSALLLVFLFDFTSFGVILMLGGPRFTTLEVEIYIQTMQFLNLPLASLLSLLQMAFSMLITWFLVRSGRALSVPIMPRGRRHLHLAPRTPGQRFFVVGMGTLLVILLVLPLIALLLQSVLVLDAEKWRFSLQFFRQLFINVRRSIFYVAPIAALRNSMLIALGASCLSLGLAFLVVRTTEGRRVLQRLLNGLVMLPLGTSAVTFGLGLFLAFGLGMAASRWFALLLPVAHALIALPFVLRLLEPALRSIPRSLKWAAASLGAAPRAVWRYVELPIIWRAALTALVYSFAISLGEFGATSFLARPDMPTLPIAIYRYMSLPGSMNFGQAMAMAVILLIACAASMLGVDRLQINAGGTDPQEER